MIMVCDHLEEAHVRIEAAQSTLAQLELGFLGDDALAAVIELLRIADLHLRAVR